jgi:hypothetical protein
MNKEHYWEKSQEQSNDLFPVTPTIYHMARSIECIRRQAYSKHHAYNMSATQSYPELDQAFYEHIHKLSTNHIHIKM